MTRAYRSLAPGLLLFAFAMTGCGSSDLVIQSAETGAPQDDAVLVEVDDDTGAEPADLFDESSALPDPGDPSPDPEAAQPKDLAAEEVQVPPVGDGPPTRQACTNQLGSALSQTHGRLDGYLVAIVPPGGSNCNADSSHVHLQVKMSGAVYDVAVNVGSAPPSDVWHDDFDAPMPDGAWAEGWHPGYALDYVKVGVHATTFTNQSMDGLVTELQDELADANHVSVFATAYGSDGAHLVHRTGGGNDGAIVVKPLSAKPHFLMFRFSDQSF